MRGSWSDWRRGSCWSRAWTERRGTYADVRPDVDLNLDARRTGFEADLVVKERPSVAPVWDAVTDEHTGIPVNNVPDASWIMDSARVFPVTVDSDVRGEHDAAEFRHLGAVQVPG